MKKPYEQPQVEIIEFSIEITNNVSAANTSDLITCYSSDFDW